MVLVTALGFASAQAPAWSSQNRWGSYYTGGYGFANDVWGRSPGSQDIWVNSASNWGVWADHPATGGVKSYPHSGRAIDRPLGSLHHVSSNFAVTVPRRGAYNTAYDIWDNSLSHEIMLWENWTQGVGPAGTYRGTVTVGGSSWRVYVGTVGSHAIVSLLRTTPATSGSVDILAVARWVAARGWFGNGPLGQVQFGWEITSSPGGADFNVNRYGVTYN